MCPKLSDPEISQIADWIDRGAPYDESLVPDSYAEACSGRSGTVDAKARRFWAFQPLKKASPPRLGRIGAKRRLTLSIKKALAERKSG